MRRALVTMAALTALSGCSVEIEGAACEVPGSTAQCPAGQACGIDLRCSKNPQLICPAPGAEIAVDPGAPAIEGITPTGYAGTEPCRFKTLAGALAVATGGTTVKIYGRGTPLTLDLGSTLPVVLPSGLTLTTSAATPAPGDFTLQASTGTADVLHLENGATLRGVTVKSDGVTGDVLEVVCGSAATNVDAALDSVVVDGGSAAARGVVVAGACHLAANKLEVRGAAGDGLVVAASGTGGADVTGLNLHDNGGYGAVVTSGRLGLLGTASQAVVTANDLGGVRADGNGVNVSLDTLALTANGGAGLFLNAPGGSASLTSLSIARNAASQYGPIPQQPGGGVIFRGTQPPTFSWSRNIICSNAGDELGVYASNSWNLAGTDTTCVATPVVNSYVGDPLNGGRLAYSTSAPVDVTYTFWSSDTPDTGSGSGSGFDLEPNCGFKAPPTGCN